MQMPRKKAIYTVITGQYDLLFPPATHQPGWDCICFTDSDTLTSNFWQVRPLPELPELAGQSDAKKARLVKILPHRFLHEYDYSVYIDANRILVGSLTDYIRQYGAPDLLCLGSYYKDAYEATKDLLSAGKDKNPFALAPGAEVSKEEKQLLKQQMKQWKKAGLPKNGGCPETAVLARRHMQVADVMETWARLVQDGSRHDTLLFPLACHMAGAAWENGLSPLVQPGGLFSPAEQFAPAVFHVGRIADVDKLPLPEYPENPPPPGGEYGGWPLLLSISLPVSNQGDTIERCLSGVGPILDALPAELIVVDTGSTDKTIPIAKSHGARIIDFPWVDDMSAARNAGIRAARGLWYMSIDADEWFDDTTEIIEFFKKGRYKGFDAASYNQRNFLNKEMKKWQEHPTTRMGRRDATLHFEGRIHDALVGHGGARAAYIPSIANHLGFAKDSRLKTMDKVLRNMRILRADMAQFPQELRYAFQMMQEYEIIEQSMDALRVGWWALSLERQYPNRPVRKTLLNHMATSLFVARAYTELLQFVSAFIEIKDFNHFDAAKFYFILTVAHARLNNTQQAKANYQKYLARRGRYLALNETERHLQWVEAGGNDMTDDENYTKLKLMIEG